jgi:HK97 family phage major capsid protein
VPRTTPLLAYVDVIPTTTDLVVDVSETTRTTAAGQADHGFALPESTSFTVTPTQLRPSPWGTWGQAAKGALADSAYAAKTIDRLFRGTFLRALEAQILAGDGSDVAGVRQLVGVLNTPGVVVTPRGATTNIDAIATAVASVQTAEFSLDAPPVVAVAPATHKIIHTSKDAENGYLRVADALGQPVVWHLSNSVPAGTAVVGDFSAARLWVRDFDPIREDGGLRIEVSDQHQDYFIKGLVALRLAADLTFRVALPAAFQVVTGLS